MRKVSNEQGKIKLMEVTVDHADDLIWTGRRALLAFMGLVATAGCSSNPGHSYGYGAGYHYGGSRYYGRNTYHRSPARRGRRR